MRRRRALDVDATADLLVFDGRHYRTEQAWATAFRAFRDAREAWADAHGGGALPQYEINGYCPIDMSRFRKSNQ